MSAPRQRPHFTSERQHDAYDEGWEAGRESIAASLADAFRAGAEYVRGVSFAMGWINHPATPPIVVAPTNEGITAAAEGYVSALAESASVGLECPHCGDVAYESIDEPIATTADEPVTDGQPTLAEWIAPFDERGRRLRCTYHDGSLGLWHFLSGAVVGWQSDSDDIGPEGPVLYRDGRSEGVYIPNPAELRAMLDELASRGGVP